MKRYYPYPYFSNWVDNFMPFLASKFLFLIYKINFITPNLLTFLSFFLYLKASFLILLNFSFKNIIISILFFTSYLFDCLDGQLSRIRKASTDVGKFLDNVLDYLKVYFIFLFTGLNVFFETKNVVYIILALSSAFFFGLRFYIKEQIIYIMMEKDKNYLEIFFKERDKLYKKIFLRRKKNSLLKNIFDVNWHILRVDEGEIIFFTLIGLWLNKLNIILYFFFFIQLFWIIFRLIQRSYQLFKKYNFIQPILR